MVNKKLALTIIIALLIWLPRVTNLNHFVTADEHAWLARSANFYRALSRGEYADTFQRHHPGVTVTWAGTLGFLTTYPNYAQDAPRQFGWLTEEIEPFLAEQGFAAIDLLAAGRWFVVLMITLALTLAFRQFLHLTNLPIAAFGFGLIAFAPFHVGLSRLMHLDGLLSAFMLLSVLAFLRALYHGSTGALTLSGIAAGLAWLTRSPGLFLIPFLGLVALAEWGLKSHGLKSRSRDLWQTIRLMLVWGVVGLITVVLLWPAMWVDPLGSVGRVLGAAGNYAAEGHLKPTFFNGEVYGGDPGAIFYAVAYLWRITPITMIGLVIGLIGMVFGGTVGRKGTPLRTLLVLLAFAVSFGLFMNLGAKKFDRYLLPSHLPLLLMAGYGWSSLVAWVWQKWGGTAQPDTRSSGVERGSVAEDGSVRADTRTSGADWGSVADDGSVRADTRSSGADRGIVAGVFPARPHVPTIAGIIILQAAFALWTAPYFLTFYNPLMGGSERAPQVMMIGWGEGADQAARDVTAELVPKDDAVPVVASAYTNGPYSYFYAGRSLPIYFWHQADYAVLYAQDFQRRLPSPRQIAHFESQTPVQTVRLNGIDYAKVYDVAAMETPDYMTSWGMSEPLIGLVSYQFPASVVPPGETLNTTLYLENIAPIAEDWSVVARLVAQDGTEVVRSEGWPWGSPTSTWRVGDVWPDGHALEIPADAAVGFYRLDVGFVDPALGGLVPATQAATGMPLGEYLTLDFVAVGDPYVGGHSVMILEPPALLGEMIELDGAALSAPTLQAGETLTVTLAWEATTRVRMDYTSFVHVVGPNGLLTQNDQPPLGGFLPTSYWHVGRDVVDALPLAIPADAPPGTYAIHVGMYDFATGDRLPIAREGKVIGDSVVVAELIVE